MGLVGTQGPQPPSEVNHTLQMPFLFSLITVVVISDWLHGSGRPTKQTFFSTLNCVTLKIQDLMLVL